MAHQGARNRIINDRNWLYSALKLALKIAMAASIVQITISMSVACQRLRERPIVCTFRPEEYRFTTFEDKRLKKINNIYGARNQAGRADGRPDMGSDAPGNFVATAAPTICSRIAGSIPPSDAAQMTAHEKGFKFVSDPANTSTTIFAQIGREHNGVFFNNNED